MTSLRRGGHRRDDARGRRRRRPPGRRAVGRAARSSARTSRGATAPTTCDLGVLARGDGPGDAVRPVANRAPAAAARRRPGSPTGCRSSTRKPEWLRPKVHHGPEVMALKHTVRDLGLVTVCEDAGCPNLSECWADGTATFMVLGDRCTRACGFCLVDTRQPLAPAARRAGARRRGDRPDGPRPRRAHDGRARRPRRRRHGARRGLRRGDPRPPARRRAVETLISDAQGDADVAGAAVRRPPRRAQPQRRDGRPAAAGGAPVGRLRPSASPCSPAPRRPGWSTKSGFMVGLGETDDEIVGLPRRPRRHRRRHRHDRPVPAADVAPPAGRALGRAGRVRARGSRSARRSASATSRPAR